MEHERIDDEEVSDEQLQRLGVEEYSQSPIIIPRLNGFDNGEHDRLFREWADRVIGDGTNQRIVGIVPTPSEIRDSLEVNGDAIVAGNVRMQVIDNEVEILKTQINTLEDKVAELEQMIWQLQEKDNEQDVP